MSNQKTPVWETECRTETHASPEAIWALFKDISGWERWNPGIEQIELHGPFAAGTKLTVKPAGREALVSRLLEVTENSGFLDETCIGDLKVYVDHRIEPIAAGRTGIVYSLEAFGRAGDEIGPLFSAGFPAVLKALARLAESESSRAA